MLIIQGNGELGDEVMMKCRVIGKKKNIRISRVFGIEAKYNS